MSVVAETLGQFDDVRRSRAAKLSEVEAAERAATAVGAQVDCLGHSSSPLASYVLDMTALFGVVNVVLVLLAAADRWRRRGLPAVPVVLIVALLAGAIGWGARWFVLDAVHRRLGLRPRRHSPSTHSALWALGLASGLTFVVLAHTTGLLVAGAIVALARTRRAATLTTATRPHPVTHGARPSSTHPAPSAAGSAVTAGGPGRRR